MPFTLGIVPGVIINMMKIYITLIVVQLAELLSGDWKAKI